MKKTVVTGMVLAAAAGLMFMATPILAAESTPTPQQAKVKCLGGNDCSGQSACKTATSAGPGQNSCKGQGFVMTKTAQECKEKGGHVAEM